MYLCYQLHAKKITVWLLSKTFCLYLFSYLNGEKKISPELKCLLIDQLKKGTTKWYEKTQTKNKTVRKYSNDKVQFTFFYLPYGRWVNGFFPISLQLSHIGRKILKLFLFLTMFQFINVIDLSEVFL